MATKRKTTLLKEALNTLKAIKRLDIDYDENTDQPMHRAFKRVDRILAKAKKAA